MSQSPMGWLNDEPINICLNDVEEDVSHPHMSWSNADAPANIQSKVVTQPTDHFDMSGLQVLLKENNPFISSTFEISQSSTGPYFE